jgi:hypothetical protein
MAKRGAKVKKAAAVVNALSQYEKWAISITSHAATHMPPSDKKRMVRFDPLCEIIPEGYINPKIPPFTKLDLLQRKHSLRKPKLDEAVGIVLTSHDRTLSEDNKRSSIAFRINELNRGGWKKW